MKVMSVFSGVSAAATAWRPLGFEFVAYAEIDPYACRVLQKNLRTTAPRYLPAGLSVDEYPYFGLHGGPGTPNFGDVTQISDDDLRALGPVDVLEGGSPCQDFSLSGLRQGLDGSRGNLTLAFCRLAIRMRRLNGLRWVVWENVTGALSDRTNAFGCVTAALVGELGGPLQPPRSGWTNAGEVSGPDGNLAWRVLEAEHFGSPATRKRVYLVANVEAGSRRQERGAEVLFEQPGDPWSPELLPSECPGEGRGADFDPEGSSIGPIYSSALCSKGYWRKDKAYALKASNAHNPPVIAYRRDGNAVVRRLTPDECDRLIGGEDMSRLYDITYGPPRTFHGDDSRYRAIGNSMDVRVMRAIGRRLKKVGYEYDCTLLAAV